MYVDVSGRVVRLSAVLIPQFSAQYYALYRCTLEWIFIVSSSVLFQYTQ